MIRILNWDRIPDSKIIGPVIVPIDAIHIDKAYLDERTIKHYVKTDTQVWYAEPITTVRKGGEYYANGAYSDSLVEACRRLGYKDLLIVFVDIK